MRALGLDLGGTNIKLALLEDGVLVEQREAATRSEDGGPAAVLARLVELTEPQPEWVVLDVSTGGGHTARCAMTRPFFISVESRREWSPAAQAGDFP